MHLPHLIALGSLASCVAPAPGYRPAKAPGIHVVPASHAKASSLPSARKTLKFARNSTNEAMLTAFLRDSRAQGASLVSSVEIHHFTTVDGKALDCMTELSPKLESQLRTEQDFVPGSSERVRVSRPVTRMQTQYVRECKQVSRPVTRTRTVYEQVYDFSSKSYRSVPRTRTDTSYESRTECHSVPRMRTVTNYETQWQSQDTPARWEQTTRRYARWSLVESEAACKPGGPARDYLTATVHGKDLDPATYAAKAKGRGQACSAAQVCSAGLQCNANTQLCALPAKRGEVGGRCISSHRCSPGLICDPRSTRCLKPTRQCRGSDAGRACSQRR